MLWFLPLKSIVSHFPTYPAAYFHSSAEALHRAPLVKVHFPDFRPHSIRSLYLTWYNVPVEKQKRGPFFFFFSVLANTSSNQQLLEWAPRLGAFLQWACIGRPEGSHGNKRPPTSSAKLQRRNTTREHSTRGISSLCSASKDSPEGLVFELELITSLHLTDS